MTAGTGISTLGDQIGWLALLWLVMIMSGSSVQMALAGLCYGLPSVVAGIVAGMLVDRFPALRLVVLDNVGQGLLFGAIPVLHWMHLLPFWLLCTILVCAGTLSPLTSVGAMAIVPDLVPADLLVEASAWEETLWQGAYLAGPLIGGLLITVMGASTAILVDGLSFWACALCMLFVAQVHTAPFDERKPGYGIASFASDAKAGLKGLFSLPVVLAITLIALILNLAYGQLDVSLPLLVHHQWHLGGATLGVLWTAYGIGSLVGTAAMGFIRTDGRRGFWMSAMVAGMGGSLLLMPWAHGPMGSGSRCC